jgi:cytochrome P450
VAKHPEAERRLAEEVGREVGARPVAFADLPRLKYTEQAVKEALRLYPPTWILIQREAVAEVELGGYRLPRGAWVFLSPWVTQRDPRFFEDPERFDPDRFAPGRAEKVPQYAYFPFGAGPHVCVGNAFATMEMTLLAATVVQRFRLRLAPGQGDAEPEPHIAIRPRGGLRLEVTPAGRADTT